MSRFKQDQTAQQTLSQTVKLADVKSEDYDSVFYVGGHGPMWISRKAQFPSLYSNPSTIQVS